MSDNKSARLELERVFGKKCMIEEIGIRYIPKKERRKIKGYTKYDDVLTFHHIKEKYKGGKSTPENGALVKGYNHRWLHSLPENQKEQVNIALQEYKLSILAKNVEFDEDDNTQEIIKEVVLDFNPREFKTLPAFDTDKKPNKKKKFNRAKNKRELQKMVDEELYGDDEDIYSDVGDDFDKGVEEDMSRIIDPREMMIRKLHNAVKGQAQLVLWDNSLTPEEKKEDFEVIEEFKDYVDNYHGNQRKLAEYSEMKTKYDEMKEDYDKMKIEYDKIKVKYDSWLKDWLDDGR